jgi:hypothetical protein
MGCCHGRLLTAMPQRNKNGGGHGYHSDRCQKPGPKLTVPLQLMRAIDHSLLVQQHGGRELGQCDFPVMIDIHFFKQTAGMAKREDTNA